MAKILQTANANKNDEQQDGSAQDICGAQAGPGGSFPWRNEHQIVVAREGKEQ